MTSLASDEDEDVDDTRDGSCKFRLQDYAARGKADDVCLALLQ